MLKNKNNCEAYSNNSIIIFKTQKQIVNFFLIKCMFYFFKKIIFYAVFCNHNLFI